MRPLKITKNSDGNLLIIMVLILLIISLNVWLLISPSMLASSKVTIQKGIEENIEIVQYSLLGMLTDARSWRQTYIAAENGNLSRCMSDPTFVCPEGTFPLVVKDATGAIQFDSRSDANGFDLYGAPCATYATAGQDLCQLRYKISWTPDCAMPSLCRMPSIILTLTLSTNFAIGTSVPINTSRYMVKLKVD